MYGSSLIARYVIQYCKEHNYSISNLKLQKILYFIQAEFLVTKGIPCFAEDIEAWDFGPVIPNVYHEYKIFGSSNIISFGTNDYSGMIQTDDLALIRGIVDECASYSASALVDITHHQSPWENAYQKHCNNKITNQSIKEFFENN